MYINPSYFIFMIPGLLLMLWAQSRVQGAYKKYGAIPNTLGTFKVIAVATDNAGKSALSNSITLTVVNPGNVVGGVVQGVGTTVQGVGTVVQNLPSTLSNTVNNLLGALHL